MVKHCANRQSIILNSDEIQKTSNTVCGAKLQVNLYKHNEKDLTLQKKCSDS